MTKKNPIDHASPPNAVVPPNAVHLNDSQQAAFSRICLGNGNIVLIGQVNSGKTTVLNSVADQLEKDGKKVLRCAPTRITASAFGPEVHTIYTALGLPIDLIQDGKPVSIPDHRIKKIDCLMIDSFHRCTPLLVDIIWKSYLTAKQDGHPFRLIIAADFFQIGPWIDDSLRKEMKNLPEYKHKNSLPNFPFQAAHWDDFSFEKLFLNLPYEPVSPDFAKVLSHLRIGDSNALPKIERMTAKEPIKDAIWIFTRKNAVAKKNEECICALDKEIIHIPSLCSGRIPESESTMPKVLDLCEGMKVIFTINDPQKRFFNGTFGYIQSISLDPKKDYRVYVTVPGQKGRIRLYRHKWNFQGANDDNIGELSQFPVLPGYASTLHKIGGWRWDSVNINPKCWGHGQLYSLLALVSDPAKIHLSGHLSRENLIVSAEVKDWEEAEFYHYLDFEEMQEEVSYLTKLVHLNYIPDKGRRNGLRFGVHTHKLVVNGQTVCRSFLVLRNEKGQTVRVTNFTNYLRLTKPREITSDIGHKAYYIAQFLNYVCIDVGEVERLEEISIDDVRSFIYAYGNNLYGGHSHTAATFQECLCLLLRFLTALIKDSSLDMTLTMNDLFVEDVSLGRKGAKLVLKRHPNFAISYDPEDHFILRDMPEAAFRLLLSIAVRDYPDLLMNLALGYCAGLRPSETCSLSMSDLRLDWGKSGDLLSVNIDLTKEKPLRDDSKATGKIKKPRAALVHKVFFPLFQAFLKIYLPWWKVHCKDAVYQPLCLDYSGKAMSYQDYYRRFKRLIKDLIPYLKKDPNEAICSYGRLLEAEGVAPHLLRHLYTQTLVSMGFNLYQIQNLRGDSSIESAQVYMARKEDLTKLFDGILNKIVETLKDEDLAKAAKKATGQAPL